MQTPSLPPESQSSERPVVLVVDDAPSSLGMLCDTLEASGYTVLVPIVEEVLGRWQRLLDKDLAAVNAQLHGAGLAPLVVEAAAAKTPQ